MIRKGATDECQQLDRQFSGNMKNKAKSIHQKNVARKVLEYMISRMEFEFDKPILFYISILVQVLNYLNASYKNLKAQKPEVVNRFF